MSPASETRRPRPSAKEEVRSQGSPPPSPPPLADPLRPLPRTKGLRSALRPTQRFRAPGAVPGPTPQAVRPARPRRPGPGQRGFPILAALAVLGEFFNAAALGQLFTLAPRSFAVIFLTLAFGAFFIGARDKAFVGCESLGRLSLGKVAALACFFSAAVSLALPSLEFGVGQLTALSPLLHRPTPEFLGTLGAALLGW